MGEMAEGLWKRAWEEGYEKTMLKSIINVMDSLNIPAEEAMEKLKIPASEQEKYRKML